MRNRLRHLVIGAGLLACAFAAPEARAAGLNACFDKAGEFYGVSPAVLRAIAWVESGYNRTARNVNADGSEDLGIMQINSWWLSALKPYGISRDKLLSDACLNVHIGAWILKQEIQRLGPSWRAVGAYNAKSPDKARSYARKVQRIYLMQGGSVAVPGPEEMVDRPSPVQPKLRTAER